MGKSLAANVVMHRGVIGRLAPAPARQIPIWKLGDAVVCGDEAARVTLWFRFNC